MTAAAVPLDPGNCDEGALADTRDAFHAAPLHARGDALVDGLLVACPAATEELRLALDFWAGRGDPHETKANLAGRLCPNREPLVDQPLGGSYVNRIEDVWRNCGLNKQGLLKKRETHRTAGPIAAALGSRLYERWKARGIDKQLAAELGRMVAGLEPLDRGLFGDVASEAVGAALPQSGGPGPAAMTACAPVVVLDVGAIRLDGQGLSVGTPEERDGQVLRALPGLETALAAWLPPEGCPVPEHVVIAPDAGAQYDQLLPVLETVQLAGLRSRLLVAQAPDISLSGEPRTRWDGLRIKSWPIDLGSSPDVDLAHRVQPPPVMRIGDGTIDIAATGVQPARQDCGEGVRATVCATENKHDPAQYDWTTLFRAASDVRTARGVGAIDSVVVVPTGSLTIGVMVKALDAWAWAVREEGTELLAPPPIVLTDPDRKALDGDVGAELEALPPPVLPPAGDMPAGAMPPPAGAMPPFPLVPPPSLVPPADMPPPAEDMTPPAEDPPVRKEKETADPE